jgi:hypothetical protein
MTTVIFLRWLLATVCVVCVLLPTGLRAQDRAPRFSVEVEAGAVWQSYNDVEIPNDGSASRFSLSDLAGTGPWAAGRIYVTWRPNARHGLRLLAAPLSLSGAGVASAPIRFAGETYAAGAVARATYTFNSYRLTYRYRLHTGDRTTGWIGLTAKIRDAAIALEQGGTTSRKDDLGFVPLLHLSAEWHCAYAWRLSLDADVIAGGPGRAEDVALKLGRDLGARSAVAVGYRLVEGGADVTDVYTFAWLHYAVVAVRRHW